MYNSVLWKVSQALLQKKILKLIRYNKLYQLTGTELWKCIESIQKIHKYDPPKDVSISVKVKKERIEGRTCFILSPKQHTPAKAILYLYGGGYVAEISQMHWRFLKYLVQHTQYEMIVPMYPLAPNYTYKDVFEMLVPLYKEMLKSFTKEDIILMGDSSGGSIALAFAELLKEKDLPQPNKILLISPSVDMTVSNPEMLPIARLDPILAIPGTREIGKRYAGEKDPSFYLVSPLYGNVSRLAPIYLFVGTHELCLPDCRKLVKKLQHTAGPICYYEYPNMVHNWPLLFFPESKKARKEIISILHT